MEWRGQDERERKNRKEKKKKRLKIITHELNDDKGTHFADGRACCKKKWMKKIVCYATRSVDRENT